MRGVGDLGERRGERHGLAADFRAAAIGAIFARAADRHLHQHGGKGREDHHQDHADSTQRIVAVARAAEEHAEIGEHGNGARDGGGHRHHKRVAVLYVGQLMRHHARHLVTVEDAQQARGGGNGRVFGLRPVAKALGCGLSMR